MRFIFFIFFFFAILLITVHSYVNLTFLIVVVINTAIGIVQELKSKQVLDKLTMLNVPKSQGFRIIKSIKFLSGNLRVYYIVVVYDKEASFLVSQHQKNQQF